MASRFYLGRCDLDLHVENCQSLKDKRRVVASLKEKLKNNFNVAVCEFGDLSLWQRTQLGIVTCSNERGAVDAVLKKMLEYLKRNPLISVIDYTLEIM